jgi:hypothetical protein
MTPYDIELNAAILHLSDKLLPRGFEVSTTPQSIDSQAKVIAAGGRITVPLEDHPDNSLFADADVEHAFRALVAWGLFQPDTLAIHGHGEFVGCPLQIAESVRILHRELIARFGDDERTQSWARILTVYLMANIAYQIVQAHYTHTTSDWDRRGVAETAIKRVPADDSAEDIGKHLAGFIAYTVENAPRPIVVNSPEELHELLRKLGAVNDLPTDDTGQQTAPTSRAVN